MSQAGFTPIQLYFSTTAAAVPTAGNLANGELAINITDGKLYYKSNAGVVTLLAGATAGPAGGSNTQVQFNSSGALAGSANMTFNGTTLTVNDLTDSSLTAGRVTFAGTAGNLTDSANLTWNGSTLAVTGAFSATTTIAAGGAIKSTGANLVNEASAIKLSQEGVALSSITAYGNDASTQGTLRIRMASSDGTASAIPALFSSTGLAVTGTLSATSTITASSGASGASIALVTIGTANNTVGGSGNQLLFNYGSNASSRSWKLVNDFNAFGDLCIAQSTTQTGSTYSTIAQFNSTGLGIGTAPTVQIDANKGGSAYSGNLYLTGRFTDGTAALKGIGLGYDNSSQTGLIYAFTGFAASSLAFWTYPGSGSAAEVGRFTSAGRFGIGSSNPSTNLVIGGTAASGGASGGLGVFLSRGVSTNFYEAFDGTKSFIAGVDDTQGYAKVGTLSQHPVALVAGNGNGFLYLNTSGNLSLGITASTYSGLTAGRFEFGAIGNSVFSNGSNNAFYSQNTNYDGGYKYATTAAAALYLQSSAQHIWYQAGSGTAGTGISFTQSMTINASGNLLVGTTSSTTTSVGGFTLTDSKVHIQSLSSANSNSTAFSAQKAAFWIESDASATNSEYAKTALLISSYEGASSNPGALARFYRQVSPSAPARVFEVNFLGNIGLGDTNASTSGTGITFPATQSASSNANTLDDYEEGTWTPTLGGDGGQSGQTYGYQDATYTKVGNTVTARFDLRATAKGTITGLLQIQGLPFTVGTGYGYVSYFQDMATNVGYIGLQGSGTAMFITGTTAAAVSCTYFTTTNISNTVFIQGTIVYKV